jgi:hypothetical protein
VYVDVYEYVYEDVYVDEDVYVGVDEYVYAVGAVGRGPWSPD